MNRLSLVFLVVALSVGTVHAQSGATDSGSCASHLNTAPVEEVSLGALLNCIAEMQRDIEELKDARGLDEAAVRALVQDETSGIETGMTKTQVRELIGEGQGLPDRIVVASTVACAELGPGWQRFEEASARFLVGAATEDDLNDGPARFRRGDNGEPLTPRPPGQPGGAEMVLLEEAHMPAHSHTVPYAGADTPVGRPPTGQNVGVRETIKLSDPTSTVGDSRPHYNMPPYIALHFCVKNGG